MKAASKSPSYEKPALSYWSANKLNEIEAKMSGGGGGWVSSPKKGRDTATSTITYQGKSDYRFQNIKQTASLGYSFSTAGPDSSANVTYFTIDIVGACKACKIIDGGYSDINILREAEISVAISENDESKLYYSSQSEVFSNPSARGYGSLASEEMSDMLSLLGLCAGVVSNGLGTAMSITSFVASKLFKNNTDNSCSELYGYGSYRYNEFVQGMRLLLKVPPTQKGTKVTITYYANGESSETDSIRFSTSFTVYGR